MIETPANTLDTTDAGDDVAARFDYQNCNGAMSLLRMLTADSEIAALICENFEDQVVVFNDDTYAGVQVKTRDLSQPPFRANDSAVVDAFARFCRLENRFPGVFRSFDFVTNHGFWQAPKGDLEGDLHRILTFVKERAKGVSGLRKDHPARLWVARVAAAASFDEADVVAALRKCNITSRQNTINVARRDVADAVMECPRCDELQYSTIKRIADAAIELVRASSSRKLKGSIFELYELGESFGSALAKQTMEGKILRKKDIDDVVDQLTGEEATFEPLVGDAGITLQDLPKTLGRLVQKMALGSVHTARINQMESLVHQVEALYLRWYNRYGAEKATQRLNHLLAVAESECSEAMAAADQGQLPYGSRMFDELKVRVKARCLEDPQAVFKCLPEHLLGAAGVLTEACKVWWSPKATLVGE